MKASWNKQLTGHGRIEGQACSYPCSVTWAHEGSWVSAGRGWGGVRTMGRVTRGLPPPGTKAPAWPSLGKCWALFSVASDTPPKVIFR